MEPIRIIGYLRVSTDQQVESTLGLEAQRLACEDFANKNGSKIFEIFIDEGLSGSLSLEKRPGMLQAISILKKGDILVCAKRDRLGRDPLVVAMIESAVMRKGAKIISAAGEGTENDDPSSVLMRRIIDAFSEYERLIIKARTKAALKAKRDKGQRVGHIPYGYQLSNDGKHIEVSQVEQLILNQMKELRRKGLSLYNVAKTMNNYLLLNRDNKKWNKSSIYRILIVAKNY